MKSIFAFLFAFNLNHSNCDLNDKDLVYWTDSTAINISNFKGKPKSNYFKNKIQIYALTFSDIQICAEQIDENIYFTVVCVFSERKSWFIGNSTMLLEHERTHFNINELFARKIRKKITELKIEGEIDYNVFEESIKKILNKFHDYTNCYDSDTGFGTIESRQKNWNDKINVELAQLSKYKDINC